MRKINLMRNALSHPHLHVRSAGVRMALVALITLAAAPAGARADTCAAPPGTAAIEQYCENIPTPAGKTGGHSGGGGSSSSIPAATAQRLAAGGAGALLAVPGGSPRESKHSQAGRQPRERTRTPAPSGSPLDAIGSSLSNGGDSVGGGLVWVLLAITLALGGAAWLRFRRRPPTAN